MPSVFPTQIVRDDSLRWINFFNGRLLTGDDLTQEQAANRDARLRLGQALGDGVAWGLWASANPHEKQVVVSAGEAVNRQGQVLSLSQPQAVSLALPPKNQGASNVGWFNACDSKPGADSSLNGLYVLALGPAEGLEGLAPVSGLGSAAAACNSKYRTEAVQFKLIQVPAPAFDLKLRNVAAYDYLGLDNVNAFLEDPFGLQPESYGRLDGLRPAPLTDDDMPLALIFRDAEGIRFVDNWSVRRRVRLNAHAPNSPWHIFLGDRRTSENEAAFLQFQAQLADLLRFESAAVTAANFYAGDRFKYLPPVGLLPTGANGLHWQSFLGIHGPLKETPIDLGLLDQILLAALPGQPITLTTAPYVAVDVYRVPHSDFVLFCRSELGRLEIQFSQGTAPVASGAQPVALSDSIEATPGAAPAETPAPAQPSGEDGNNFAALVLHARESNLKVNVRARADGKIFSPNLSPGVYRLTGSVGNFAIPGKMIRIIGGRITLLTLPIEGLTSENIYLDLTGFRRDDKDPVRLCLVAGTFADAVEEADAQTKPWLREDMRAIEMGGQPDAVRERLDLWKRLFQQRFPSLGVENTQPQLFAHTTYNHPDPAKVQSLPEVPQAYVVFGKLGFPLTVIAGINPEAPLSPWNSVQIPFNADGDLAAALERYEIPYLDQLAGAWVQGIVEATSLTSAQARRLIVYAIKKVQKR